MNYAFVFPGQGSQSVGMMAGFAGLPVVRQTFVEASEILGQDLWALVEAGPAELLNQTVNTQPLMLAAGVAVYRAWMSVTDSRPTFMAGHSLGEYTALVAANSISFSDALPLVRFRAECMQQAVPEGQGGIAAILGLDDDAVRSVCVEAAAGEVVEAVNFNSPGQVVIAGSKAAVLRAMEIAKAHGAKRAIMLPMSVPSHCSLLAGAAERLLERLGSIRIATPEIPLLHNVDVASHGDPASIRRALASQLFNPVRWVETIRELGARGITHVAECGPGKVLAGLNKRIDASQTALALTDAAAIEEAKAVLI